MPAGTIVALIGEAGAGAQEILALAEATVGDSTLDNTADESCRDLVLLQPFALDDALTKERGIARLNEARRSGAAILLYSHDEALIERICDEVWWIRDRALVHRGSPRETLDLYRRHVAIRGRSEAGLSELAPVFRRGDGRAELIAIETLDGEGRPCARWASGEQAGVRVVVRFRGRAEDPVVGILIRTRVGLDVFGTNTELEGIRVGPVVAGDRMEIYFTFICALCPQEYTITAASHDPDGVWHDWMEDAVAVTVTDTRYTAGVANLRARVEVVRNPK